MASKKPEVRAVGQRSITSTFLFRVASDRCRSGDTEKDVEIKVPRRKGSRPSLSDFLNRKLHRSSVLPTSVQQGQELPFSSPISGGNSDKGAEGARVKKEVETKFSIDGAFDLFKNVERDKNGSEGPRPSSETEIFYVDDVQETRKRKNPSQGGDDKPTAGKRLAVLGEDSKPVQRSTGRKSLANKDSVPLFNHYKNGGGWWNDNMEGVDNEEVGCNDVAWEGVGCTTLGGIEWH